MVVKNTGLEFIAGTFDNLAQGQLVALSFGGTVYNFVANYYGGRGNDLVLAWAGTPAYGWGLNGSAQIGDNSSTTRVMPVPVAATAGVLFRKTVGVSSRRAEVTASRYASDGTVAAWGCNDYSQLGLLSSGHFFFPVAVNMPSGSELFGKTVVSVAAGWAYSLALCSDGTMAAWGDNSDGQLGDNTKTRSYGPVPVNFKPGSALSGKTVVAIAAGSAHSMALCSDGTVAAWDDDAAGQLGDNTMSDRLLPVAVNIAPGVSALAGKTVVAIAAGRYHSLALCADGTVRHGVTTPRPARRQHHNGAPRTSGGECDAGNLRTLRQDGRRHRGRQ